MAIDKKKFGASLRSMRKLYQQHVQGKLSPSGFTTQTRQELNSLYMEHTRSLIEATAALITVELHSFQTQFGLDLESDLSLRQVTRGYRGIRAEMRVWHKGTHFGAIIYIGPFDEWSKITAHTSKELEHWPRPSFYTKRKKNRWKEVSEFDFPELLQRIKEDSEKPPPEVEDDIPF